MISNTAYLLLPCETADGFKISFNIFVLLVLLFNPLKFNLLL